MFRIFIADPDFGTRKALTLLLRRKLGIENIVEIEDMEALVRALAGTPPDLLLLDWRLDGSPAAETCRLLRKAYPGLKIVLLSLDAGDAAPAREAGADFIYKGASPHELIATLTPLLRKNSKSSLLLERLSVNLADWQRKLDKATGKESIMQTNRSNAGTLVAGAILIFFGLLALAGQLLNVMDWGFIWPLAIVGVGSMFFLAMVAGGKQYAAFAVPGSIISGIGLILLFENVTGHWRTMSYFWTLIVLFVGVGIYLMGWYGGDTGQRRAGWRVMRIGFILFIIFGAFFEMIFASSNLVFPALLILLGIYLILARSGPFSEKKLDEPTDNSLPPAS